MACRVIWYREKVQIHRRVLGTRKHSVRRLPEMSVWEKNREKEAEVIQQCHSTGWEINEMHFHRVHTSILVDY